MSNDDNIVSENLETTTTIDTAQPSMPKKRNKLVPIVIVALVILVILGGGFYYYFSRPSKIVSGLINSAYDNFSSALKKADEHDLTKETIRFSGDLNIDTNIDGLENLKKETFEYTLGLDYSNKKVELGGALKENKKAILDVIAYVIDKDLYVSFKDDYDKLIHVDADDADIDLDEIWDLEKSDISVDDIDYIVKEFKDILIESIDMDELEKTSATTEIDGKDTKVTKITYNLNARNSKKFVTAFINNTLENKDLLKKLAKISDTDVSDIKDSLKDAKNELKDTDMGNLGKFNIYTKGLLNKVVKVEFSADGAKIGYVIDKEIYVRSDDVNATITIKENTDEKLDMSYSIKANDEKISGNITITNKSNKKNVEEGTINFSFKYDDYKFTVKSNYKAEYGIKIADVNTKKAVDANKASDDLEDVLEDIGKRIEKSSFYELIEALPTSYFTSHADSAYSYDDDDDYNYSYSYSYDYDDDDDDSYSYDYDWDY